ncbi:MAG: response regulator, partial [Proteobacteria bacterium]|nr:response regulator [Pseudomonadota bacterium]
RRQSLRPSAVDPARLVEGVGELVRRTVGPSVRVAVAPRAGGWRALCDANQLESALLNLAINARDAMPDGGVITLATAEHRLQRAEVPDGEEAAAGDYVEFSVADQGTGMTPEVLARAFEPFFTTKPVGQGTGLGLSQAYGFARQSGGFVRIESTPGRGTTVRLLIPRSDAAAERPEEADPQHDAAASLGAPPARRIAPDDIPPGARVLVVEDEANVREQVATVLRERGCMVLEAADGSSGLDLMQAQERLDMLVTDVGLPGLNGRQLAEAARRRYPRIPVLLITGYADTALHDLSPAEGMEVLAKPFDLDRLAAHVAASLGGAGVA